MMRPLRWLAGALIFLLALPAAAALGATPAAAASPVDRAMQTLQHFGIVQGDPSGDLRLQAGITRAELTKVLVTAAGQEAEAVRLRAVAAFSDTEDHWAAGHIAVARNLGLSTGYPGGTFRPQAPVSYAEAVTLLLRLVGIPPGAGAWPDNYIAAATAAGIVPADLIGSFDDPARRGVVFLLAHNAFAAPVGGTNLYQQVFDAIPPVLTVEPLPVETDSARVTLRGRVSGAAALTVNQQPVVLGGGGTAAETFAATVDLSPGANTVTVVARDEAGNIAQAVLSVRRVQQVVREARRIQAPERIDLAAGAAEPLALRVEDQFGEALAGAAVAGAVTPAALGAFIPAGAAAGAAAGEGGATFVAGAAPGSGTLTLTSGGATVTVAVTVRAGPPARLTVTPSAAVTGPDRPVTLTVAGEDAHGNSVPVSPGFTVSGGSARVDGHTFVATEPGTYTVTARDGDAEGAATIDVYGAVAGLRIAGPDAVVGNDASNATLTITAVDAGGRTVPETGLVILSFDRQQVHLNDNTLPDGGAVPLAKGTAEVKVRGRSAAVGAEAPITVTFDSNTNGKLDFGESIAATHIITVDEQVPAGFKVASDPRLRTALGVETAKVTAAVLDQDGQPMTGGAWDVQWSVDGPATGTGGKTAGSGLTNLGAFALTLTSVQGGAGPVTVSLALTDYPGVTATVTIDAYIGTPPTRLQVSVSPAAIAAAGALGSAGGEATVTITAVDADGLPANVPYAANLNLAFDAAAVDFFGDGQNARSDADTGAKDHILTPRIQAGETAAKVRLAFTRPGTYAFTVADAAGTLAGAAGSITVKPGAPAKVAWTRGENGLVVGIGDPSGTVHLQLYDALGNKTAQAGLAFTVKAYDGAAETSEVTLNDSPRSTTVTTDAGGAATVAVSTRPYTNRNYKVQITGGSGLVDIDTTADEVRVHVWSAAPSALELTLRKGPASNDSQVGSVKAGEPVYAWITIRDRFGSQLTDLPLPALLALDVDSGVWDADGQPETIADRDADDFTMPVGSTDGSFVLPLTAARAGEARVGVKLDLGSQTLTAGATVRVTPGPDHHLVLAPADGGVVALEPGKLTPVTLQVADAWDNVKDGAATYNATFADLPGGDGDGTDLVVRAAADGADLPRGGSGAVKVRTATTIYLLLPPGGDADGFVRVDDADGLLEPRTYTVAPK